MGKGELKQDGAAASAQPSVVTVTAEEFQRCNPFIEFKSVDDLKEAASQGVALARMGRPGAASGKRDAKLCMGRLSREEYQIAIAIMEGDITELKALKANFNGLKCEFNYSYTFSSSSEWNGDYGKGTHNLSFFDLAAVFGRDEILAYLMEEAKSLWPFYVYSSRRVGYWAIKGGKVNIIEKFFTPREEGSQRSKLKVSNIPLEAAIDLMLHKKLPISRRMEILKLLLSQGLSLSLFQRRPNLDSQPDLDLRLVFLVQPIVENYKTPVEKAAALLIAHTEKKANLFLNAAASVLHALPGSKDRLQSDTFQDTGTVKRLEAIARFNNMSSDDIIDDVIGSIRKEESHTGDYLVCLERYLRIFVFDQDAAVVYGDANTNAVQQQKERPTDSVVAAGIATSTLDEPKAASVSSSRGVVGPGFFDPDAAPASVMFRSLPRAAATSVAAAEPQPPSAAASAASSASAAQPKAVSAGSVAEGDLLGLGDISDTEVVPEVDLINLDDDEPVPARASVAERDVVPGAEFLDLFGLSKAADEQKTTAIRGASADAGKNVKQAVPLLG